MQQYLNPPQEAPYMKNATFYLLDNDTTVDGLSAVEQLVCEIAAERWRSGKRVLIACEDEKVYCLAFGVAYLGASGRKLCPA